MDVARVDRPRRAARRRRPRSPRPGMHQGHRVGRHVTLPRRRPPAPSGSRAPRWCGRASPAGGRETTAPCCCRRKTAPRSPAPRARASCWPSCSQACPSWTWPIQNSGSRAMASARMLDGAREVAALERHLRRDRVVHRVERLQLASALAGAAWPRPGGRSARGRARACDARGRRRDRGRSPAGTTASAVSPVPIEPEARPFRAHGALPAGRERPATARADASRTRERTAVGGTSLLIGLATRTLAMPAHASA